MLIVFFASPNVSVCSQDERCRLTTRIQNAGTEVVEAKAGAVSLHFGLSPAIAVHCLGLEGEGDQNSYF